MSSNPQERIIAGLTALVPEDGTPIGNTALRRALEARLTMEGITLTEVDYWQAHTVLIAQGVLLKGQGRGGSVRRNVAQGGGDFALEPQTHTPDAPKPAANAKAKPTVRANPNDTTQVIAYRHLDKRVNNPEVGMVTPATDPDEGKTSWAYDPHIDPALQFDPQRATIEALIDDALASGDKDRMQEALEELKRLQSPCLNWAGKAERTRFEIDTVSLHVHERIDPASILAAVRKEFLVSNYQFSASDRASSKRKTKNSQLKTQFDLFNAPFENLPLRDAIDFYRHERGWANRLIAGDSLLVMNSLLQKESMAGRVEMIYIDPPYGVKYGSNFQPFVGKRDVKDRNDADLTQEPEMLKAFRDTWELGIHSYLTYLRDRLLLARELLHESGSVFVQISDENLHHVREIMDEVFGSENFVSQVTFAKTSSATVNLLPSTADYILWFAKDKARVKYHSLLLRKAYGEEGADKYDQIALPEGPRRALTRKEKIEPESIPERGKIYRLDNMMSQSEGRDKGHGAACWFPIVLDGQEFLPNKKNRWKSNEDGIRRLKAARRIQTTSKSLAYVRFLDDFPAYAISNVWTDIGGIQSRADPKVYVVQTAIKAVERCLLMTTDPGDLVLDPTCGSGTTAFVAEKWGRRWITCDTSRVAVTLAKQRLMTASYDYYELRHPHEGLKGGFLYKTVPHVTLKSIANNPDIDTLYEQMHPAIVESLVRLNAVISEQWSGAGKQWSGARGQRAADSLAPDHRPQTPAPLQEWEVPYEFEELAAKYSLTPDHQPLFTAFHAARQAMQKQMDASIAAHADQETLYDQPAISKSKLRISGPFTVEAVPFPTVKSLDEASGPEEADASIARTGESGRQHQWRDELLKTGIRGKGGQVLRFADLEALPTDPDICNLHATGHLETGERVVVSFGPEYAALEQRQVSNAMNEAGNLFPLPKMIVFCSFAFDPEAAKDIDAIKGITALKAQMNTDLLTEDLKKNRASNESYWLMGQPEISVNSGQWLVASNGEPICRHEQYQELSRLVGLAEVDGLGPEHLHPHCAISARGALRPDRANAAGGGIDTLEHRRRLIKELHRRISEFSRHCPGVAGGTGDATHAGGAAIPLTGTGTQPPPGNRGNWSVTEWPDACAALQRLTAEHWPLTTVHYHQVEVHGFDYFDTVKGELVSGGKSKIALWALDPDYDERSLFPRQVFFPMANKGEGWEKLKKSIRAELDESRLHQFQGTVSLPFEAGENRKIAVKIIDDRGIESLKVMALS